MTTKAVPFVSLVISAALAAFCFGQGSPPQESKTPGEPLIMTAKPLPTTGGENELRRLLIERYNSAVAEFRTMYPLYGAGRLVATDVCDAVERFAKAGSELAETPVARVSELALALDAAKAVESAVQAKQAHGLEPIEMLEHARGTRLDIEIQLLRAREAAKAAAVPK